jgi:carbonic anhydrase
MRRPPVSRTACSDQGAAPDNVSFASPGQFYIAQNLAASVGGAEEGREPSLLGSIHYAVDFQGAEHGLCAGILRAG